MTIDELIAELFKLPGKSTVTLVIDSDDGGQVVCSGNISVDTAELNTNNEVMLVGNDDA